MQNMGGQSKPNWRAIAVFYFLACLWLWPFFWWRDIHTTSWNAWHLPEEIKGLTQPWGASPRCDSSLLPLSPGAIPIRLSFGLLMEAIRPVLRDADFLCMHRICHSVGAFLLQARLLSACGRLLDAGRGSGLAGIPPRCTATPGKASRLPTSGAHVGSLALHLAYERHTVRSDFSIGNNSSRRRGHHIRPGISNGAHGLGGSRYSRP